MEPNNLPPFGYVGQVTGRVAKGTIGEVVIAIHGGTIRYYAHPSEEAMTIPVGQTVLVVEYQPPQTVVVEPAPWAELPDLS